MRYLTVDIGSTYTKLVAIDAHRIEVLATSASFTTISDDVTIGFNKALAILEGKIGKFNYDRLLCCSSAAGGLKMVALGLVPSLTAKAARMAASSAGAKVVKTYSFEITEEEAREIERIAPDLVLLSGGTDGGNKEIIVSNATKLAKLKGNFSIIIAGNKSANDEITSVLKESDKEWILTQNVMPEFNKLNIEPAKECIRKLFIQRIVEAKGLSKIANMSGYDIIPTPLAVMQGCSLLSKGTEKQSGLGDLIAVDLGGATTDFYSMANGEPTAENMIFRGLPEPFEKRSVEGDLGMRYSIESLIEECGIGYLTKEAGVSEKALLAWKEKCIANPDVIAVKGEESEKIENALAKGAVKIAAERHCGYIESVYTPMGQVFMINGKDLSNIQLVIGIGGAIINSPDPAFILDGVKKGRTEFSYAKPINPSYKIDAKYILSAMGLLAAHAPEAALTIMKREIL